MRTAPTPVSVVICTRDRSGSLVRAVRSVLASRHPCFELVIIDQSADRRTAAAIAPLAAREPRLRYLRAAPEGAAAGRNAGLSAAVTEVVAFTDDDCEVPPHWLETLTTPLLDDESLALAYCAVVAAPHDPARGVVPAYGREGEAVVSTLSEWLESRGIGAGMAVRREAVLTLGGFDRALRAYEDRDIAVRALCRGYRVFLTGAVAVVHHGFRTWDELPDLARRNWAGFGSAHAKFLKSGRPDLIAFCVRELRTLVRTRAQGPHPWRLQAVRMAAYARALAAGLVRPIDRETLRFSGGRLPLAPPG